jgi:methyl-accepting chemotaxis protein
MTIAKKLSCFFGGMVVILMLLGVYNIRTMGRIKQASTEIAKNWMPSAAHLAAINHLGSDFRIAQYEHAMENDPAKMKQYEEAMQKIVAQIKENEEKYKLLLSSENEKSVHESYNKSWAEYLKIHENQFIPSSRELDEVSSYKVLGRSETLFVKASEHLNEGVAINSQGGRDASQAADRTYVQAIRATIVFLITVFILTAMLAIVLIHAIVNPLRILTDAAADIGKGKLETRVEIKSKDEIGKLAASYNKMAQDLSVSMQKETALAAAAAAAAESEKKKAEELARVNEELASTNEELLQSNEELQSATEELRKATERAQKAKEEAENKSVKLDRFNKYTVGRELKMVEMKGEIDGPERVNEFETVFICN